MESLVMKLTMKKLPQLILLSIAIPTMSYAFDDSYSSTSTVYTSNAEKPPTDSGTNNVNNGQNLRYPYIDCVNLGMKNENLSNCVAVSFPTDSPKFYSAYPEKNESSFDRIRNSEEFQKLLNNKQFEDIKKIYADLYLAQGVYDWDIPTAEQLQKLYNLEKQGALFNDKNRYTDGCYAIKIGSSYTIGYIGQPNSKCADIKLPNLVSSGVLVGDTLTNVTGAPIIVNFNWIKRGLYQTTVSGFKKESRIDVGVSIPKNELLKWGFSSDLLAANAIKGDVILGIPDVHGVISNPVYTLRTHYAVRPGDVWEFYSKGEENADVWKAKLNSNAKYQLQYVIVDKSTNKAVYSELFRL